MIIIHPPKEYKGHKSEDVFIIRDDEGSRQLAECLISEQRSEYYPRKYRVMLDINTNREAFDLIIGASLARAKELCGKSDTDARIYAECDAGDVEYIKMLRQYSFDSGDALLRMDMTIPAYISAKLPDWCSRIDDNLSDFTERRLFLDRWLSVFGTPLGIERLDDITSKDGFRRIMCVDKQGMAGEVICWLESARGIIGFVFTAERCRDMNIAQTLVKLANIYLRDSGAVTVRANVPDALPYAVNTFSKAGFSRTKELKRYPGINIDKTGR